MRTEKSKSEVMLWCRVPWPTSLAELTAALDATGTCRLPPSIPMKMPRDLGLISFGEDQKQTPDPCGREFSNFVRVGCGLKITKVKQFRRGTTTPEQAMAVGQLDDMKI